MLIFGGIGVYMVYRSRAASTPAQTLFSVSGLHVVGNALENDQGQQVILRGVNRSSIEYFCLNNWGFLAHGPVDATAVQAIKNWHVNAVRIPLNEDCLLNINGPQSTYVGQAYLTAVHNFVNLLNQANIAVILDLHWTNAGTSLANAQTPMPDQDHAPAAWTAIANEFKGNSSVIFDLFNEPYPDNNQDTTAAWTCWLNGGTCSGVHFTVAGMQELVNTVRATGATNPLLLGGVAYAAHISRWMQYKPNDPLNNLMAAVHIYPDLSQCNTQTCWDNEIAPVAQQVPVIMGEIGERDCGHTLVDPLMAWADAHNIGYTAWSWIQSGCASEPSLISDYSGTATAYGVGVQNHLAALSGTTPTPVASLTAAPNTISGGGSATLTWNSSNASTCTASGGWSGSKATSGSQSVAPAATTTYTITCSSASASATVTVNSSVPVVGDCTGDGHVTIIDLSTLLTRYGTNYPACDFNNDGVIGILDLSKLLSNYGA